MKEVDSLFIQMDKDNSGELVLAEVSQALKTLKSKHASQREKMNLAAQTAQKCRERANLFHDAVVKVEAFERAVADFERAVAPSAELRLGALLVRRGLKPADAIAKLRSAGATGASTSAAADSSSATIDAATFCQVMSKLALGASEDELKDIFTGLDVAGAGKLDTADLYAMLRTLHEKKQLAAQNEKKLAKAVTSVKEQALAAQQSMKLLLEQEQRQQAEKEEQERAAKAAEAESAQRAKQEAAAKSAAEKAAKEAQKAEFEARIRKRRELSAVTPVMVDLTPSTQETTPSSQTPLASYRTAEDVSA